MDYIAAAKNFFVDEKGATAVEYAIMASAIGAVIVTVVFIIGLKVQYEFVDLKDSMANQGM